ncbi:MAG: GumC family protein [Acidiferrobacteraceae bacterium]
MTEVRSFRDIVRLFFIYQREFRWAVIVTVVVATLGAFLLPTRYQSTARLLVKPGGADMLLPIGASGRQVMLSPVPQHDLVTNDEKILTGQQIVMQVARRLLAERAAAPPPRSLWKRAKVDFGRVGRAGVRGARDVLTFVGIVDHSTRAERLSRALIKRFSVRRVPGSSIMALHFQWNNAHMAQEVLGGWIHVYLRYRQHVLGNPTDLYTFYGDQAHKERLLSAKYRQQLVALERQTQGISVRARANVLAKQIETAEAHQAEEQSQLVALTQGIAGNRHLLPETAPMVPRERKIGLNPVLLDLKRRMDGLEVKRVNLLRTYTPQAPPVVALDKAISVLATRIHKTRHQIALASTLGANSVFTSLEQGLVNRRIQRRELRARLAEKHRQIRELIAARERVMAIEPRASVLERLLRTAEHNYAHYMGDAEKARIAQALSVNRISNIAVVEPATLDPARVFPKSLDILVAALPLGILMGLIVIYVYHLVDQRIHDGGLVEHTLHVPLWASVPETGTPVRPEFAASLQRLIALLPLEQVSQGGLTIGLTSATRGEGVHFLSGHIEQLLSARGYSTQRGSGKAGAGQIVLAESPALLHDESAIGNLAGADIILLVVEAGRTTTSAVREVLRVLAMTFKQADGIILNRRRFEIPEHVLHWIERWRAVPADR